GGMKALIHACSNAFPIISKDDALAPAQYSFEYLLQLVRSRVACVDKQFRYPFVGITEKQQAVGGFAVSAGTSNLLIVGFDRIRDIGMSHETYIGTVDSHAESIGGDNDSRLTRHKAILHRLSLCQRESGVIRNGVHTIAA